MMIDYCDEDDDDYDNEYNNHDSDNSCLKKKLIPIRNEVDS